MSRDDAASVPDRLREAGGLLEGVARDIARETGVPEAHVWGIGSFYHMLSRSEAKVRVCTGLSCLLGGAQDVLDAAKAQWRRPPASPAATCPRRSSGTAAPCRT